MFNTSILKATRSLFLLAPLALAAQVSFADQNISFNTNQTYPESAAWSATQNVFFVGSVHRGVIGKVTKQGHYSEFITDKKLVASVGIKFDEKRNKLWVINSDSGASVRSSEATQGQLASVVVYDATTGKRLAYYDLGHLFDGAHFANDLALDNNGNAYVTDSFSPVIYRIDTKGITTVFATSDLFKGESFNLNGIVYHPAGFLLVAKYNSGELFRIDIKHPENIEKVNLSEAIQGADGLLLHSPNKLVVVQNMGINRTIELVSSNDWKSAKIEHVEKSILPFPTSVTAVGKELYILNAQLNTLFTPDAEKTGEYLLQKY